MLTVFRTKNRQCPWRQWCNIQGVKSNLLRRTIRRRRPGEQFQRAEGTLGEHGAEGSQGEVGEKKF